jgi:protein-S-isoprenylcysteine O-methyltransferase Ste14
MASEALTSATISTTLMLVGMFVQISAKVTLWRSFGIVAANRGVKVEGPYRFVRHPMYAGDVITHVGFLLAFPSWQNAAVYMGSLAIQVFRLLREERVLNLDPVYRAYASKVRYRLLPGVF